VAAFAPPGEARLARARQRIEALGFGALLGAFLRIADVVEEAVAL
jgi:hypothetical protein